MKQSGRQVGSRNYPQALKRQVSQQACEPNVSVSKLALDRGLNANQVFRWRRQYRAGQFGPVQAEHVAPAALEAEQFHVVSLAEAAEPSMAPLLREERPEAIAGVMRLSLLRGELMIEGTPDRETLDLVLRCLMR